MFVVVGGIVVDSSCRVSGYATWGAGRHSRHAWRDCVSALTNRFTPSTFLTISTLPKGQVLGNLTLTDALNLSKAIR